MKYGNVNLSNFHGSKKYLDYVNLDLWRDGVEIEQGVKHIVTQTRTLRYRFYPHFHHYVEGLKQRLIEKSLPGLQAADTEYAPSLNNDGTYQTLPFSFQVALPIGLILQLPIPGKHEEFETITLHSSVPVKLPDGIKIKLADGNVATLPGSVIARDTQHGTRVVLDDGTAIVDLNIGTEVLLASKATLTLPTAILITGGDGQLRRLTELSIVKVPDGTRVKLLGGKPRPALFREIFTNAQYAPTDMVEQPYPVRDLDFTSSGAYSVYNWELFYHIPLAVAMHLSKNQRYEDAQRWFHFLFDPTDDSDGATPERFWKVKPFQFTEVKQIEDILVNLSSGTDSVLQNDTINSINAWKDSPFRPHLVARYRHTAYMYKVVMAYLDNLIAWGDDLFRQDTGESINEATQIYVMAALILGERPQALPKKGTLTPLTYASKRGKWDEFDNTLVQMESELLFDLAPLPMPSEESEQFATLQSIGTSLFFCVPRNDKLMSYWDTVADRLFKIRNSMNLQGVFRQLPLFEPPIDPALLARATAAGVDISAVVAGINQPLPLIRFQLLVQKASEICQEVKSLGNNLLSALEKEDNEKLALLRAQHETVILGLVEKVKYAQWQEAIKNCETLEVSLNNAKERYIYYELMLGKSASDIKIPDLESLDTKGLEDFKFKGNDYEELKRRNVKIDIAQDLGASGGKIVSSYEAKELNAMHSARDWQVRASTMATAASTSYYIPTFHAEAAFWGMGVAFEFGGQHVGPALQAISEYQRNLSSQDTYEATMNAKIAGYDRREQDWAQQSNLAVGEINQIFKQLRAAQIREHMSWREWQNHKEQMNQSTAIENFLKNEKNEDSKKKTTVSFYTWLKRDVRGMFAQVYQFAFDEAKKAERALQYELGKPNQTFMQYGYMSGKEGLLAGEKLYLDLKRMEMAYHELNQREYELTKHISLLQVDPLALITFRTTGQCTVKIPESLFDLDGPGHYFRRIKTVSLSIPCVTGPYASINCMLTLQKSEIRKSQNLSQEGNYAREDTEDDRFSDYFGSLQSIVTSSAQNDSGLFETNLRDERYLPFENSGVISEWLLQLPADPSRKEDLCQFDYSTISDVILHIRYTAREGGVQLREGAKKTINDQIKDAQAAGSVRLFSVRHEFPTDWAKFQNQKPEANKRFELALQLRKEHYPYWSKNRLDKVESIELLVRGADTSLNIFESSDKTIDTKKGTLEVPLGNLLKGKLTAGLPESPVGMLELYFDSKELADLWIAVKWSGEA
ncbi:hypothetical protein SAMN04487767_106249 [Bacillus wiedmannii]|uniref:Tc toxin complex TcA C-terminal TcB-binding domain-containing protein n=1 Tax=Bacillus wiedmannii TaxID=1890302 RepID=A0A1G6V9H3_9BACI|nr:insecticidal toxin protein [Bacillus wiedmannii]SDD50104.1 hypothetical protein SAMN04487767_106249 [Bacillus wiedmannii]